MNDSTLALIEKTEWEGERWGREAGLVQQKEENSPGQASAISAFSTLKERQIQAIKNFKFQKVKKILLVETRLYAESTQS